LRRSNGGGDEEEGRQGRLPGGAVGCFLGVASSSRAGVAASVKRGIKDGLETFSFAGVMNTGQIGGVGLRIVGGLGAWD
jgi:hypothetical protein